MELAPVDSKTCFQCKKNKSLSCFYKNKRKRDGHEHRCITCEQERYQSRKEQILATSKATRDKNRTEREAERERLGIRMKRTPEEKAARIKERTKEWNLKNKERLTTQKRVRNASPKIKEQNRAYYLRTKDKQLAQSKVHYEQNKTHLAAVRKTWRESNRDKVNAYAHTRRTLVANNGGSYTLDEWLIVLEHYSHQCLCCGAKGEETKLGKLCVDHCLPVSLGGTSNANNLSPLCQRCNTCKGNKPIDYRLDENRHESVIINHSVILPWLRPADAVDIASN